MKYLLCLALVAISPAFGWSQSHYLTPSAGTTVRIHYDNVINGQYFEMLESTNEKGYRSKQYLIKSRGRVYWWYGVQKTEGKWPKMHFFVVEHWGQPNQKTIFKEVNWDIPGSEEMERVWPQEFLSYRSFWNTVQRGTESYQQLRRLPYTPSIRSLQRPWFPLWDGHL
ncbi:MAG TPA: hypothetical protein DCR93_05460 [Cytophagales bacterium]|nr:hypothetical protein [Cytophagales bacterium]HAP58959.1 hypothetical protein [Cytophagales bacterium]